MSLYTQFIFQIGLMMIWLSIFDLNMYDNLLDLQVVQRCRRSILTGCIYDLDMGCLCPLIFSLLMHIQIGGLDLGCLCPKSHDFMILSSCRRDEMLLLGIVMAEDCG